jgi:hypothetical protein
MERFAWLFMCGVLVTACSGSKGKSVIADGNPAGSNGDGDADAQDGSDHGIIGDGDEDGDGDGVTPTCMDACTDFPAAPLRASDDITDDEIAQFDDAGELATASFCVVEPQLSEGNRPGAMYPVNWLRPRFRWQGGDAELYEIRLHADSQVNDLRAYTRKSEWTLPSKVWKSGARNLHSVEVTIRAVKNGKITGARGSFEVAPVEAGGSMVFWATSSSQVGADTSKLYGFSVGDEAVIETLRTDTVQTTPMLHENGRDLRGEYGGKPGFQPGDVQCIGCHEGTPDGEAVVFTDDYPWPKVVASVKDGSMGTTPSYVSAGAQVLLKQPWLGTQSMSPAHFSEGDRILIASYGSRSIPFSTTTDQQDRLVWFDLETNADIPGEVPDLSSTSPTRDQMMMLRNQTIEQARGTAWDTLTMTGESRSAVTPSFSHDGTRIAYVSTDVSPNGHPAYEATVADVRVVPYNGGAGGKVESLPGAASADWLEYYPAFSKDDAFIAFTRAPAKGGANPDGPYYNRNGEIYVVKSDGSKHPVRLAANDPPACTGEASPGVLNSWPKWSPKPRSQDGKTYYFIVFSSARTYLDSFDIPRSAYTPATLDTRASQLYMAAVVVDDKSGAVTTYPAVYLWNQNRLVVDKQVQRVSTSNLTPAWAEFEIPPVVVL